MYNFNPYSYNALPVGSIEEAKTAPIDLSGNPVFYFNRVENEVYLKQFDVQTGKTYFGKYVFVQPPMEEQPKDEIKELKEQIAGLYKLFADKEVKPKENKKAVKDDE